MLKTVEIEAHGSLCDFLSVPVSGQGPDRFAKSTYSFDIRQWAKDAFESLGIPHPEVDLLLINGRSSEFSADLEHGDLLQVYPAFYPGEERRPASKVRRPPLDPWKFVVDENLGKLKNSLRLLGFDTSSDRRWHDAELAEISAREKRLLLTRDAALLKRSLIEDGYWVRNDDPFEQVVEVLQRFPTIWPAAQPFTRCLDCNVPLESCPVEETRGHIPPRIQNFYREFFRCPSCRKIFWKGSHFDSMKSWLQDLTQRL